MTYNRRGALAVIGSCVAIFWPGAFIFGFPGVMSSYWQESLQVGHGPIGHVMFFVLAAVGFLMYLVGRLQAKIGLRRMMTFGAVLCGLDMLLLAFPLSLPLIYVWAFVMGAASCCIYLPALTTVQIWFPAKRGLVSGVVNCIYGLSAGIMSPIFGLFLFKFGFFPMSVALGVTTLVVAGLAAQFTDPPEPDPEVEPADAGGPDPEAVELVRRSLTVSESLRTRNFWLFNMIWVLQGAASVAMVTLATHFGLSMGWSFAAAVSILTIFSIVNGVSRLVVGHLSDVIGRNTLMSIVFLAAGVSYLLLPHVEDFVAVTVLAAVIGAGMGTLFAVSAPLAVDCFGITYFGAIYGLIFISYGFLAAPLGPSLSGFLLDMTDGDYVLVFSYLGVFCLISGILIRFVRPGAEHRFSA